MHVDPDSTGNKISVTFIAAAAVVGVGSVIEAMLLIVLENEVRECAVEADAGAVKAQNLGVHLRTLLLSLRTRIHFARGEGVRAAPSLQSTKGLQLQLGEAPTVFQCCELAFVLRDGANDRVLIG